MRSTDYWGRDQDQVLVSPFPPNEPDPPGLPVIDFSEVMPFPLAGVDTTTSKTSMLLAAVGVVALVGLGVYLARNG